jgi:hypothetical protein
LRVLELSFRAMRKLLKSSQPSEIARNKKLKNLPTRSKS